VGADEVTTTALAITQELAPELAHAQEVMALIKDIRIDNQGDYDFVSGIVKDIKAKYNAIESRRKELRKPHLERKAEVDDLCRPALGALYDIEMLCKEKIGQYAQAQERVRVAAMQASAALYQAGGTPTAIIPETPQAQGVSVRMIWAQEVTDPEMVPRAFCSPNMALIKAARDWAAYTEQYPPNPIPGVRFYLTPSVRVGGGK
jgi:hypothetical protein